MSEYKWAVEEAGGLRVASGVAPSQDCAMREVTRYAHQYAEDGPVRWWVKCGRRILLRGFSGGTGKGKT